MMIQVNLPDDLTSAEGDQVTTEAIRQVLRKSKRSDAEEVALINAVVDELNAEAADTLEYQALS
jgi:hypothetical protein